MKTSRRNKRNAIAKAEKLKGAPPPLSKYAAKQRGVVSSTDDYRQRLKDMYEG